MTTDFCVSSANSASIPSGTPELVKLAKELSQSVRDILFRGSGMSSMAVYVNYAHGNESLNEVYGEEWRVRKLRHLKEKYDPMGKFNFYNPIM